jgi:AraC-like DNA-binding protein
MQPAIPDIAPKLDNIDMITRDGDNRAMEIGTVCINVFGGFERHRHLDEGWYELHFILENGGTFANNDIEYPCRAGNLFCSGPQDWHQAWTERKDRNMTIYSVSFRPGSQDQDLINLVLHRFSLAPLLSIGKGYALVFEDMRRKINSRDPLQIQSGIFRLISFMYDILSGQTRDHQPRGQMYVDEALSIMQGSITGSLDLDELVGKLGIDKSYFIRLFKQIMGVPPLKYYLNLKMDAAGHSLRSSQKTVHEIAHDFGYSDEYYFSRIFKTHVGMAPQDWRRQS